MSENPEDLTVDVADNAELIEQLRADVASEPTTQAPEQTRSRSIDEKIRAKKIENDITEADQKLKILTLLVLFVFLSIETIVVFALAFKQGFASSGFHLDEWSFRVVITATIGQITAMLTIAVQHLFPKKERR